MYPISFIRYHAVHCSNYAILKKTSEKRWHCCQLSSQEVTQWWTSVLELDKD